MVTPKYSSRFAWAGFYLALTGIVGLAFLHRLPALNPPSLWLDDESVAVLVKSASVNEFLSFHPPIPLGFLWMLKGLRGVLGEEDWILQVFPFACGLIQIILIGLLARQLTGCFSIGLLAAGLLAANEVLAIFSMRVKPFAIDGLTTLLMLWVAVYALRERNAKAFLVLAMVAATSPLVSFTAVFSGAVLLNVVAFDLIVLNRERSAGIAAMRALWVLSNAGILLIWMAFFPHSTSSVLVSFWSECFMPVTSLQRLLSFLRGNGLEFFTAAFPAKLHLLALLIVPGIVWLLRTTERRLLGMAFLALYFAVFAASALKQYPIGGGIGGSRTGIFAFPVTILAAALGFHRMLGRIRILPPVALIALLSFAGYEMLRTKCAYPRVADRAMVEQLNLVAKPGDYVIVYPYANWAVGYYGRWPVRLVRAEDSTNGYYVNLNRPNTLVLRETLAGVEFHTQCGVLRTQLSPFLTGSPFRVLYVAAMVDPDPEQCLIDTVTSRGYHIAGIEKREKASFIIFERSALGHEGQALGSNKSESLPGLAGICNNRWIK